MRRWLLFGLSLTCLGAGLWILCSKEPSSSGITLEWHEVEWGDETSPLARSDGYEYRTVRFRNDGVEDIVPAFLFAQETPTETKVQGFAESFGNAKTFLPGSQTFMRYRRKKGGVTNVCVIAFEFSATELGKRVEQRKRFPWAKVLLPLRYRIVWASEPAPGVVRSKEEMEAVRSFSAPKLVVGDAWSNRAFVPAPATTGVWDLSL